MSLPSERRRFAEAMDWDSIIEKLDGGCWKLKRSLNCGIMSRNIHEVRRTLFEHITGRNVQNLRPIRICDNSFCMNPEHWSYVSKTEQLRLKKMIGKRAL